MPSPESVQLEVKWVLLPNGLSPDGSELLCSVFVAPAVSGDGNLTLADCPDLLDWPGTVARLDLGVEFDGGQRVPARLIPEARSTAVWQALFEPSTTVTSFAGENLTQRPVMTFSSGGVLETLRDSYARTVVEVPEDELALIAPVVEAQAGTAPPFSDFAAALQNPVLQSLMGGAGVRGETLRGLFQGVQAPASGPAGDVVQAVAFHAAQEPATRPVTDAGQIEADRAALHDSIDFHRILSGLIEHPALLRQLGLVFDIAVPRTAVGVRTSGAARLAPVWTATFPEAASRQVDRPLWIAWQLDPTGPLPFTAAADGVPGVLDLGAGSPFSVQPMALDSAVLQTVSMIHALPVGGDHTAPPAVRSGGITVAHAERGKAVQADLEAATDDRRGATPDRPLRAADVVRGYRLDVLDDHGPGWRSLHLRRVTYEHGDAPLIDPVLDEGSHHPAATGPPVAAGAEPGGDAPLYVHESFVRWDGWSLSAPRPGRSLGVDPTGPRPDRPATMPQRSSNDPLTQAGVRIETRPQPRTLPRLRFGHGYRLRARTVDLAGNGLDVAAADALWQRPSITLPGGRVVAPDTLASPAVLFNRFEPVPPPTVVQPDDDRTESKHRLVIRSGTDDPATAVAEAHCLLFAPTGSIELAERHGRFDAAIGSGDAARVRASYDVAARESVVLPSTGAAAAPYLPDPLSDGVRIADALGIEPSTTLALAWPDESWPAIPPITVRLLPGDDFQPPDLDQATLSVTITLQPGLQATLRICSKIPDDSDFGLLDWAEDHLDRTLTADQAKTKKDQLTRVVYDSRHVMFTPWEQLEIVHAVQRPPAPDLRSQPDVEREPGDTDYRANCTLVPDPLTSATLQLDATWIDAVDDPGVLLERPADGQPMPWLRPVSTTVGTVPLEPPALHDGAVPITPATDLYTLKNSTMPPLQFRDTRARRITLTATAVSRFTAEFPEFADDPARFARSGTPAEAVVQSTVRPPAPVVSDVEPIVSTGSVSLDRGTLEREGGWVRIWLERPWFVSGVDEQLGVVVPRENPFGPGSPLYDYVSVVGRDAAYEGPLSFGLRIDDVLAPVAVESGVVLHEPFMASGVQSPVDLALFTPDFDFDSQRWFVDVQLSDEAYSSMARLAVVRFQPHSVTAGPKMLPRYYHVSPVVLLDPVPLFPGRTLVVTKVIKPNNSQLQLELRGQGYTATSLPDGTPNRKKEALARVTVRPQTRVPLELAGGGEHWLNGPPLDFKRDSADKPWRLHLADGDLRQFLGDAERLLVLEEDRLPADVSEISAATTAARSVFAAVVEGPFLPPGSPLTD